MKIQIYQIVHVFSVILLIGLTFSAFAAPQAHRKRWLSIATGVLSLLVLVSGFGMISVVYSNQFAGWMIVKLVAWLGIAAFAGIVFRKPNKATLFGWLTVLLALVAVAMVYLKPF